MLLRSSRLKVSFADCVAGCAGPKLIAPFQFMCAIVQAPNAPGTAASVPLVPVRSAESGFPERAFAVCNSRVPSAKDNGMAGTGADPCGVCTAQDKKEVATPASN